MEQMVFHTALGWVGVAVTDSGVSAVILPKKEKNKVEQDLVKAVRGGRRTEKTSAAAGHILDKTVAQLKRYFSGERVPFDLPLDISYYTSFQQSVWKAVAAIPYGETRSYGWIAQKIGNPRASRAVGQANGANPVPILVP